MSRTLLQTQVVEMWKLQPAVVPFDLTNEEEKEENRYERPACALRTLEVICLARLMQHFGAGETSLEMCGTEGKKTWVGARCWTSLMLSGGPESVAW